MNDLIVIELKQIGNEEINSVDARELHARLGVKKDFSNWIKDNIKKLNLVENVDYCSFAQKGEREIGATIRIEYSLSLDSGKHIAMMTNTSTAHDVRTYFIEFEKKAKSIVASLPADPIMAQLQILTTMRQDVLKMERQIHVTNVGLAETRADVTYLKENMKLENWQQNNIQKAVNHKVEIWKEMYPCLNTRKAYPAIYRHLKDKFNVPRYNEIPALEYDKAINTVRNLNLNQLAGL